MLSCARISPSAKKVRREGGELPVHRGHHAVAVGEPQNAEALVQERHHRGRDLAAGLRLQLCHQGLCGLHAPLLRRDEHVHLPIGDAPPQHIGPELSQPFGLLLSARGQRRVAVSGPVLGVAIRRHHMRHHLGIGPASRRPRGRRHCGRSRSCILAVTLLEQDPHG
jgi:hypothetical protein